MMVLSCLSLTTVPCSIRFGISEFSSLRLFGRALLRRDGLDARDVAAHLAHAAGVLQLPGGALEAQVELLLLELHELVGELVRGHRPRVAGFHRNRSLFLDALDEARLDRQLGGGEQQRFLGDFDRHAVELEQDAAGLYPRDPILDAALARAHAYFERLLGDRHVREDADPDAAGALHVARERAPRRLDLARRHPFRLQRLEAVFAEGERGARSRKAVDTALVRLAELGLDRLQHGLTLFFRSGRVAARTAGFAFGHLLVLRHRVVLHDLALEDPDLDAAGAVSRERGRDAEIDVGAQGMQRYATFAIPLHARDLGAAEPARAIDADAFRAEPHRRLHGALHRAAERDAALELLGDRFGDELGVELGLPDFHNVDDDVRVGELRHHPAQLLDIGALLADHHARTRRLDRHAALLVRTLDHDLGHRRLLQGFRQLLADQHVLVQQPAVVVLARVPARVPRPVDAETQADRIDLLTHDPSPPYALACAAVSSTCRTTMVRLANGFMILPMRPRPRGANRLITIALPTCASATMRSSMSSSWLFSAFAIADWRHLCSSFAIRLRENSRSASALATFLPRISPATRLSFCGLTRSIRATALASFSARLRSCAFLLIASPLLSSMQPAAPREPRAPDPRSAPASPCGRRNGRRTYASGRTRRTCGRPSPR